MILSEKLKYYGVNDKELLLIMSFLKHRMQFVEVGGERSKMEIINCGVPQGSVLGTFFFCMIYINDINNIDIHGKIIMFADDVSIFYPYKHDLVLKTNMERDSALLFEFARLNHLVLNANKTRLIRFRPHSRTLNQDFSIFVNGKLVKEEQETKYLGIVLKSNLSWDGYIKHLKTKISSATGILFKLRRKLNSKTKMLLYQATVHSNLEYLGIIYAYKNSVELKSLQALQNRALKCVFNLNIRHNTISLFKDYGKNILPINGIYQKQVLYYVYKSVNNIGNRTIKFSTHLNNFNTRNAENLRTARCRLETTKQRMEYAGSLLYNDIPSTFKNISRLSIFKKKIKEYLLQNIEMLLE